MNNIIAMARSQFLLPVCLRAIAMSGALFSTAAAPAQEKALVQVTDSARTNDGVLVVEIKIESPPKSALQLRGPESGPSSADSPETNLDPTPFSLAQSQLTELATEKVYSAMPVLPSEPVFGAMEVTLDLPPGAWIQMSAAFAGLFEEPPADPKTPRTFVLQIPGLETKTEFAIDETGELVKAKKR